MYVDLTLCVPRDFPEISQGNLLIYLEFSLFGIGSMKGNWTHCGLYKLGPICTQIVQNYNFNSNFDPTRMCFVFIYNAARFISQDRGGGLHC